MIDAAICTAGFGAVLLFGVVIGCIATAIALVALMRQAADRRREL